MKGINRNLYFGTGDREIVNKRHPSEPLAHADFAAKPVKCVQTGAELERFDSPITSSIRNPLTFEKFSSPLNPEAKTWRFQRRIENQLQYLVDLTFSWISTLFSSSKGVGRWPSGDGFRKAQWAKIEPPVLRRIRRPERPPDPGHPGPSLRLRCVSKRSSFARLGALLSAPKRLKEGGDPRRTKAEAIPTPPDRRTDDRMDRTFADSSSAMNVTAFSTKGSFASPASLSASGGFETACNVAETPIRRSPRLFASVPLAPKSLRLIQRAFKPLPASAYFQTRSGRKERRNMSSFHWRFSAEAFSPCGPGVSWGPRTDRTEAPEILEKAMAESDRQRSQSQAPQGNVCKSFLTSHPLRTQALA